MSDLLGIGASGVSAYRDALAAIGDNVANAETKGYARRTVTIGEAPGGAALGLGYLPSRDVGGANATSVGRAWNDFQAADVRSTAAAAGRADARQRWLSATETAIGDSNDASSVGVQITGVYTAGSALAGNPSDSGQRGAFLASLDDAAAAIRTTAGGLAAVAAGIGTEATTTVTAVNGALDQLDQVNAALVRTPGGSSAAAGLADQRDQLLDGLAANVDIDVSLDAHGAATVTLAGASAVTLTGRTGERLSLTQAADGRLAVTAIGSGAATPLAAPGGALGGLVESAGIVADRRATLDQIATRFAASINAWSAQGKTANGAAGAPLLSGAASATLTVAAGNPAAIAAASSDGTANGNLLALGAVRTADASESRWASLVSDHARVTSAAIAESSSATAISNSALESRDDTSGVDLDTEAADLLRFQQAYAGSARIIQVARETLQTILDIH